MINLVISGSLFLSLFALQKNSGRSGIVSQIHGLHFFHLLIILLFFLQSYYNLFTGYQSRHIAAYKTLFLFLTVLVYPVFFTICSGRKLSIPFITVLTLITAVNIYLRSIHYTLFSVMIIMTAFLYSLVLCFIKDEKKQGVSDIPRSVLIARWGIYLAVSSPFVLFDLLKDGNYQENPLILTFIDFLPFVFSGFGILSYVTILHPRRAGTIPSIGEEQFKEIEEYRFSAREKEILDLLLKGDSNTAIAENLSISESTVKKHINSIYRKADVASRWELLHRLRP